MNLFNRKTQPTTELSIPAGNYRIDPDHSSVEFVVRHLVAAKVRGRFDVFGGTVVVSTEFGSSAVNVTIDMTSVNTHNADRDAHIKSADFFGAENFPMATFVSTSLSPDSRQLIGALTIRGVTKPVTLEVEYQGAVVDPYGNNRIVFSAGAEIDREEFGLTWNQALETGGVLVGKTAQIEIEIEAIAVTDTDTDTP
jgi:polyisoprenoid-binding protein YceI